MALVVANEYDYGMSRMLQMKAASRNVFLSIDEACEWLHVSPDRIEWPEPP
jgi:hypothetical protein